MTCEHQFDDAAYVLGAIEPAERAHFEAHLASCAACRAAVAELSALPGILAHAPIEETVASPPREGLLANLAESTRKRRRRRRVWVVAVAAAAAVALFGVAVAFVSGPLGTEDAPSADAGESAPPVALSGEFTKVVDGDVWGALELIDRDAGTEIRIRCGYASEDQYSSRSYWLVAVNLYGETEVVGSWVSVGGDTAEATMFSRWKPDDIVALEIQGKDEFTVMRWER